MGKPTCPSDIIISDAREHYMNMARQMAFNPREYYKDFGRPCRPKRSDLDISNASLSCAEP